MNPPKGGGGGGTLVNVSTTLRPIIHEGGGGGDLHPSILRQLSLQYLWQHQWSGVAVGRQNKCPRPRSGSRACA